jgi:hypothetical protein
MSEEDLLGEQEEPQDFECYHYQTDVSAWQQALFVEFAPKTGMAVGGV